VDNVPRPLEGSDNDDVRLVYGDVKGRTQIIQIVSSTDSMARQSDVCQTYVNFFRDTIDTMTWSGHFGQFGDLVDVLATV